MADKRLRDRVTQGTKPNPDSAPYTDGPQRRVSRLADRIGRTVKQARDLAAQQAQARRRPEPQTNREAVERAGEAAHAGPPIDATLAPTTAPENMRHFVTGGRGGMDHGGGSMDEFVTGGPNGGDGEMSSFVMGGEGDQDGPSGIEVEDTFGFGGDG